MNQTRTFLIFALLAVAYMLFMAWEKDYAPQPAAAVASSSTSATPASADGSVPGATALAAPVAVPGTAQEASAQLITITTDLLRLTVDTRGGSVVRSELLSYPAVPRTKKDPDPAPVRLLDDDRAQYFVAQSGLVSSQGEAPDHRAVFQAAQTSYALAQGQDELKVDLTWQDAAGLKVTKTYTLKRGSYVVALDQKIENGGSAAWQGNAYEQLQRVAPAQQTHLVAELQRPVLAQLLRCGLVQPGGQALHPAVRRLRQEAVESQQSPVAGRRCCSITSSWPGFRPRRMPTPTPPA